MDGGIILECNGKKYEADAKANDQWHEVTIKDVSVKKGENIGRIKVLTGEFNFKSIHFK